MTAWEMRFLLLKARDKTCLWMSHTLQCSKIAPTSSCCFWRKAREGCHCNPAPQADPVYGWHLVAITHWLECKARSFRTNGTGENKQDVAYTLKRVLTPTPPQGSLTNIDVREPVGKQPKKGPSKSRSQSSPHFAPIWWQCCNLSKHSSQEAHSQPTAMHPYTMYTLGLV